MSDTPTARRYTSRRRAQQAAQTRADIISVATELFAQRGWAGTTLAAIAAEADVAVDTIYTGFGSKTGLLAAAKEVAKVGDTEQTPLMERPGFERLGEGPRMQRLQLAARLIAEINERTRPLDAVWREAAASDRELAATLREREARRHQDLADGLMRVLGRSVDAQTLDTLWAMTSPEVYAKLSTERGWTVQRYQTWLVGMLDRLTA